MTTAERAHGSAPSPAARAHAAETLPELPGLSSALSGAHGTFLELGAGYGVRARRLIDEGRMRHFSRIVLTDVGPERVRAAQQLVPEAEALVSDAGALPFGDDTVDFVFSDQVIEHVPSDRKMAAEITRVLRAGARAYVGSVLKRPWAWYFYRNGGKWRLDPTHVREYTSLDEYRSVFESAALRVTDVHVAPMFFPVGEAVVRMLVLLRIVPTANYYEIHANSRLLRALSKIRIPVPGYYGCWVSLRK